MASRASWGERRNPACCPCFRTIRQYPHPNWQSIVGTRYSVFTSCMPVRAFDEAASGRPELGLAMRSRTSAGSVSGLASPERTALTSSPPCAEHTTCFIRSVRKTTAPAGSEVVNRWVYGFPSKVWWVTRSEDMEAASPCEVCSACAHERQCTTRPIFAKRSHRPPGQRWAYLGGLRSFRASFAHVMYSGRWTNWQAQYMRRPFSLPALM